MTNTINIDTLPYQQDSAEIFLRLRDLGNRVWLDSGKPVSNYGRFDILSAEPCHVLCNPSHSLVQEHVDNFSKNLDLSTLKDYDLPYWCGAIGYLNYEYNNSHFGLTTCNSNSIETKNSTHENEKTHSYVGIFDWAIIQDHDKQKCYLITLPQCSVARRLAYRVIALGKIKEHEFSSYEKKYSLKKAPSFAVTQLKADTSATDYESAIARIKDYICKGDAYQINFSQRFSGKFKGHADSCYLALRKVLPSPFSAYIDLGPETILSFSPERFVEVHKKFASTQPIKGTAPRGESVKDDEALARQLVNSAKNRAENVMIVDLLRNDFSQSCQPFSVRTPKLFALESFANVHHLVSTVTGKLRADIRPLEFFNRCFPGGSITGAPKKRAMEIIEELEKFPRNIYCGSIFYADTRGNFDSNIAIRTVLIKDDDIYCWGGGGIVFDSTAKLEYEETFHKVKILLDALRKNDGSNG